MSKVFFKSLVFLLIVALIPGILMAQSRERGVIQGKVLEKGGAQLPGVTVTASSPSLMGITTAITDKEGKYRFPVLPGGNYTIEAALEGFTPVKKVDVILHAGMTITLDIELSMKSLQESVMVTAAPPVVDVKDSSTSKTFITQDMLQNLPNQQNVAQLFLIAPSAVAIYGNEAFVSGGSRVSNSFQVDGVELTDGFAGGTDYHARFDYNVIEEAQIIGLGASAEYGNFTGAVANVITKSGGNKLHGDFKILYSGKNWQSKNWNPSDPQFSLLSTVVPVTYTIDPSIHLGGAFIKDKLWFFAGFEYYYQKTELETTGMTSPTTFPKPFFKLTYQLDSKNKFQAFFLHHKRLQENTQIYSSLTLPEAQADLQFKITAWNFNYLHIFSSSSIFELKGSGNRQVWDNMPHSRDASIAGHYDQITGITWGNKPVWSHSWVNKVSVIASYSSFVEKFLSGSHDLKLGLEFERTPGKGGWFYTGPDEITYYDLNGQPYQAQHIRSQYEGVGLRYTFYAQDSWNITKSLVLNPGFRFNIYRGRIPSTGMTVYKPTNWEPRIGFAWDVSKDHRTVIKGHYGRYNEGMKVYNFSSLTPKLDQYYYNVGPNWETLTLRYMVPGANIITADPSLKHPYADQIVVGIEHQFTKDLGVNVSLISKRWRDFIDRVNVGCHFEPIQYTFPSTGQVFTIYQNLDPSAVRYYLTNPEKGKDIGAAYPDIVMATPYRKYRALQVTLNKRLSNKWQLSASYVYSKEKGNYSPVGIPGSESWYYDPNNQINGNGAFASTIPHIFKLQGTYLLPLGFSATAFYTFASGAPWNNTLQIRGAVNQGTITINAEPIGSRRLKAASICDLRLEKSFYLRAHRFSFMFDLFNAFNAGTVAGRYARLDSSYYGLPTGVIAPRTFQAGFRYSF